MAPLFRVGDAGSEAVAKARPASREIRFAAEAALDTRALLAASPRASGRSIVLRLRIWDTEENNGVLIYLLLADRDVEIVADRGISAKVPSGEWEQICHRMEAAFARGEFAQGVLAGIAEVSGLLARYYPPRLGDRNELPDKPAIL